MNRHPLAWGDRGSAWGLTRKSSSNPRFFMALATEPRFPGYWFDEDNAKRQMPDGVRT